MKRFLGVVYRTTALIFCAVVGLPFLYLIEPFYRIRIRDLLQDRIGHLSLMNDVELRKWQLMGKPARTFFVYVLWNPANRQLANMWRRKLFVIENRWVASAFYGMRPLLARTRFLSRPPVIEKEHEVISLSRPNLEFTDEEEREGRRRLAEMGIKERDWFICFHARDSRYLNERPGFSVRGIKDPYRNCSIENYLPAAKWIAEQGGFAIRVGMLADQPLPDLGPRVIDYATRYRSDFMDIYLAARCRFFLGNSSGLICVPICFNRPTAQANKVPLSASGLGNQQLFIPKLLRQLGSGKILTFPEAHALGLFDTSTRARWDRCEASHTYLQLGLEWVENTPEDILDLCKDMVDMIEGRPANPEAIRLQEIYRQFHFGALTSRYSSRIGPRFALKYRHLIEPELERAPGRSYPELHESA